MFDVFYLKNNIKNTIHKLTITTYIRNITQTTNSEYDKFVNLIDILFLDHFEPNYVFCNNTITLIDIINSILYKKYV